MPNLESTPAKDLPVRCHRCKWEGTADQLKGVYAHNPLLPGDVIKELGCPACLSHEWLEFKEEDIDTMDSGSSP